MNQAILTVGIAMEFAGVSLMVLGDVILGYQKKPVNWLHAGRAVRICWIVGGICIIGGLVAAGLSF